MAFCLCLETTSAGKKRLNTTESEKAINDAISKATKEKGGKLDKVSIVEVEQKGISDLSALKDLKDLPEFRTLRLDKNFYINDLGPLAELKNLHAISLNFNAITNLDPLKGLTKLKKLELKHNEIMDLTPLAELTELTGLHLNYNPNLTKAQIGRLQITLPNCTIHHNATK